MLASIGVFYQSINSEASAIHAKAEDCWKIVTYFLAVVCGDIFHVDFKCF